jgi:O-antigen/teichoic acid export membrane protein
LGIEQLGFYSKAYSLMKIPTNLLATVLNQVAFPTLSHYQTQDEKLREAFLNLTFLVAMVCIPASFLVVHHTSLIVNVLLGESWASVIPILDILALAIFFRVSYKVPAVILNVKRQFKAQMLYQAGYALGVLGFAYLFSSRGTEGVAIGALVAIVLYFCCLNFHVVRLLTIPSAVMGFIFIRPILLALFLAIISLTLQKSATGLHGIEGQIFSLFITSLAFFVYLAFGSRLLIGERGIWWRNYLLGSIATKK